MGFNEEALSYGGPILNGTCTVCSLKIVLVDKDAVLVNVAAVLAARLILRANLELDIALWNVDVATGLGALKFLKRIRSF